MGVVIRQLVVATAVSAIERGDVCLREVGQDVRHCAARHSRDQNQPGRQPGFELEEGGNRECECGTDEQDRGQSEGEAFRKTQDLHEGVRAQGDAHAQHGEDQLRRRDVVFILEIELAHGDRETPSSDRRRSKWKASRTYAVLGDVSPSIPHQSLLPLLRDDSLPGLARDGEMRDFR